MIRGHVFDSTQNSDDLTSLFLKGYLRLIVKPAVRVYGLIIGYKGVRVVRNPKVFKPAVCGSPSTITFSSDLLKLSTVAESTYKSESVFPIMESVDSNPSMRANSPLHPR